MREFRFQLLGPMRAWRAEKELEIGPPQQQAVLAVLLLSRGGHAGMTTLVDALWGDEPPKRAAGAVRTYVSRLRQILCAPDAAESIAIKTVGNGYALRGERITVDIELFERRIGAASAARGSADAADLCRSALRQWQGEPLAGLAGPYFPPVRARLLDLHAAAAEIEAAAQVEAGDRLAAIAGLRNLITTYPLRESVHELLMLALHQAGRQADALEAYESARRILRDELKIEPGPSLRRMHQRVLELDGAEGDESARARTTLSVAEPARVGESEPMATTTLPSTAADQMPLSLAQRMQAVRLRAFVGREQEIETFRSACENSALDNAAQAFTLLYFAGPGGIGKTALLRRLAHEAQEAGRPLVALGGRVGGCTSAEFEAAVQPMLDRERPVLIVDDFDRYQAIEPWLREDFLPRLPLGSIVVFAGRVGPAAEWQSDPAWQEVLRVMELGALPHRDAAGLLSLREVPAGRRAAVLAFAGGNPLALVAAAEAAKRDEGGAARKWVPSQELIGSLVPRLIGEVPSDGHRRALDACALLPTTNEELLRAVLRGSGIDCGTAFAWLRALPFMETGPRGIRPHPVVRETLDADLRWRDPGRHRQLCARIPARAGCTRAEPAKTEAAPRIVLGLRGRAVSA